MFDFDEETINKIAKERDDARAHIALLESVINRKPDLPVGPGGIEEFERLIRNAQTTNAMIRTSWGPREPAGVFITIAQAEDTLAMLRAAHELAAGRLDPNALPLSVAMRQAQAKGLWLTYQGLNPVKMGPIVMRHSGQDTAGQGPRTDWVHKGWNIRCPGWYFWLPFHQANADEIQNADCRLVTPAESQAILTGRITGND